MVEITIEHEIIEHLLSQGVYLKEGYAERINADLFTDPKLKDILQTLQKKSFLTESQAEYMYLNPGDFRQTTYLNNLFVSASPEAINEKLLEHWKLKKSPQIFNQIQQKLATNQPIENEWQELQKLRRTTISKKSTELKDILSEIADEYVNGVSKGIPTGIKLLDERTDRLQKGHFWVIGGYTGFGKTTLSLQIALKAVKKGVSVEFISLEMSAKQLLKKLVYLNYKLFGKSLPESVLELEKIPFRVIENLRTVEGLKSHLISTKAQVVFVDYIQLLRGGNSYFDEATQAANMLQEMAIQRDLCVVGLSQISKEAAKTPSSTVLGFKNSNAIAESADVAIEIYRDKNSQAQLEDAALLVKKNRHGMSGKIEGHFSVENGIFIFN